MRFNISKEPMRMLWVFLSVAFVVILAININGTAQIRTKKVKKATEVYTRPKPTKPIKPTIPSANRYTTDKVFLEKADSLYRRIYDVREHQIVKGNVIFRQAGMWMYCDSAYYYPDVNSLEAFGHVRMEQGDTLFVYADKVFYDGDRRMARLRCGISQHQVKLINRNVTLTTDSLDYDLLQELGWYAYGGKIDDKVNILTSVYGQYSPATKDADFYHDVELVNTKDGNRMITDTLFYNTSTHIARIVSPTKILGKTDTILTSSGWYNTATDNANLNSRSTILHRDSSNNVTTLEGDSIIYDRQSRITKAFMFRAPNKLPHPMIITDTARKTTLIGGFGLYNDSTREAFATEYPLLMEYSRPDTLFLRADTILTSVETRMVFQGDSIPMITVMKTEDVESADYDDDRQIHEGMNSGDIPRQVPVQIPDSSKMIPKEFHVAKAFRKARFFNQEMQGVADSMTFIEFDSMLYMNRKPVVWSGEREVYGNEIQVHFNDSTPDWAYLPDYGMMGEHVEEDFYNQLTGKEMKAFFENKDLKHLDVSGNVQTIFLPMEKDSTYNRLVDAESSFLSVDVSARKLDRLKMWPEVSGTVTPLFLIKQNQKYLPGFQWYENIRPKREWYGGRVRWADDLGEVPEELENYFNQKHTESIGRRFIPSGNKAVKSEFSPRPESSTHENSVMAE